LIPLTLRTLQRLERLTAKMREHGVNVEPMQLAGLLLEKTTAHLDEKEVKRVLPKRASR
jgi:hypothetical protein